MLELKDISKSFGAVCALDQASLTLKPGEIRAFLGANGSGKSTIVKILSGLVRPDRGTVFLDGTLRTITSPEVSRSCGIAATYQDLSLIPRMSIADNIMLGHEPGRVFTMIPERAVREAAQEYLELLGVKTPMDRLVLELDSSTQSLVELAKALSWKPRYLLLDEITASLYKEQVERLFGLVRRLASEGVGVLFVSHRMDEIFKLCGVATILRVGRTVAELQLSDASEADLVYHMTGKRIEKECREQVSERDRAGERPVLEVRELSAGTWFSGVSMKAYRGETIGIAGLQGQGQGEFLRTLYGHIQRTGGEVLVNERPVSFRAPAEAVACGFGFIPGDREREGVFHVRSVLENIFSARFALRRMLELVHLGRLTDEAKDIMTKLNIVTRSPMYPANSLSGGNQQKLVVGRWLSTSPGILLLDDPTKGVDITSRREIHAFLREMAEKGTTLLFSSSDNEELLEVSDRILVFYEGRIVEEIPGCDVTEERLAASMLGVLAGQEGR